MQSIPVHPCLSLVIRGFLFFAFFALLCGYYLRPFVVNLVFNLQLNFCHLFAWVRG